MRTSFGTVRAKLTILVALPVALIACLVPVVGSALHSSLMVAADDHCEDAEKAFQVELEDDLADLTMAVRLTADHPETVKALAGADSAKASELAGIFGHLYPEMGILLVSPDGRVLASAGSTAPPARLDELPELKALPATGEEHAVLPHGCSKPSSSDPIARAIVLSSAAGRIVACQPLNLAYLDNASRKLGLELALVAEGALTAPLAATEHFPMAALQGAKVKDQTSIVDIADSAWAVQRFEPLLKPGTRGSHPQIVAAVDVSNISRGAHHHLYMLVAAIALIAGRCHHDRRAHCERHVPCPQGSDRRVPQARKAGVRARAGAQDAR